MRRECGDCRLCCKVFEIEELPKAAGDWCPFAGKKNDPEKLRVVSCQGCGVYDARPKACRVFECAWLKGDLPEDARPDKLGVVVSVNDAKEERRVVQVLEGKTGALGSEKVRALLKQLKSQPRTFVVTVDSNGRQELTLPEGKLARGPLPPPASKTL